MKELTTTASRFVLGAGAAAYGYDKNGNISYKLTPGQADVFAHDAAGRMRQVKRSGAVIAQYGYDGDGNRVQSIVNSVTTKFVGGYFEWSGSTSTMVKYYTAGGRRLAMRTGSGSGTTGLLWLAGDHLGSTSVAANPDGSLVANSRQLYKPWGETRAGAAPTPYQYTGQRNETAIGLYFYNARWYDYTIGRFVQADTVTPAGVQGWDRYAYANNSPVKFTDPTGHNVCDGGGDPECNSNYIDPVENVDTTLSLDDQATIFGITFDGDWTDEHKIAVIAAVRLVGKAFGRRDGKGAAAVFRSVFGSINFTWGKENATGGCAASSINSGGCTSGGHQINFWSMSGDAVGNMTRRVQNVIHELGHAYDNVLDFGPREDMPWSIYTNRSEILIPNLRIGDKENLGWQQNLTPNSTETFADMFIAWTYNVWNRDPANSGRVDVAKTWIDKWVP